MGVTHIFRTADPEWLNAGSEIKRSMPYYGVEEFGKAVSCSSINDAITRMAPFVVERFLTAKAAAP